MTYRPSRQLPAHPTRAELRDAIRDATHDAKIGVPGAQEYLDAVRLISRTVYPRKASSGAQARTRRRGRLISEADVVFTCPDCRGTGGRDVDIDGHQHHWTCARCHGTGKLVGIPETLVGGFKWRGAPVDGGSNRPANRAVQTHRRGFVAGHWIGGAPRMDHLPPFLRRWPHQPGIGHSGLTPTDLSACIEGWCHKALRTGRLLPQPHSMKKLGSRRDKQNLTPRQERRASVERRLRRYQRELKQQPFGTKREVDASLRHLQALGIDVEAIEQQLREERLPVEHDPAIIAEARRRADLPPIDEPRPHVERHCCLRCGRRDCECPAAVADTKGA